jgi:hypothetical protein
MPGRKSTARIPWLSSPNVKCYLKPDPPGIAAADPTRRNRCGSLRGREGWLKGMHWQIRDHAEVALIAGTANEEIGERDHQCFVGGLDIDLRDNVADVAGKGFRWDGGEDRLQIAAALGGLLRRLGR